MVKASDIPEIKAKDEVEDLVYSEDEGKFRDSIINQANKAYSQRNGIWPEFDDMTYEQSYVSNAKNANSYIPPKINPEDVRTVSGTTREKSNALVSALLNYNLKPSVLAFDEDDMPAVDLGDSMGDMIDKSRKLENPMYDVKRPDMVKELVDQGTVFVEDSWIEWSHLEKQIKNADVTNLMKIKWDEAAKKVYKLASTEVLYGPSVYLGNMRQPYFQLQPFVITRKELTRSQAEAKYCDWERWKNVQYGITQTVSTSMNGLVSNWGSWTMVEVSQDMVEEIKYYNPWTNTFQIMLSGTMMLPIGFPLSYLTGQCRVPIACGKLEPIPHFAYGRGISHKTKFNQALLDEMYKGLILKMRKSYQPPMANNTGQTLSKRIFYPANITNNIDPSKLQEIGTNGGISNSDTQALQIIKEVIDESSVSAQFQGASSKGDQTARETVELKQQQLMKLGLSILGLMNLEVELAWLRLFLILKNWTQPIDSGIEEAKDGVKKMNQYRSESMESEFDDGEKGQRVVQFTDQELPHPEQVMNEEDLLSERKGIKIRKVYLNVDELQNIQYKFFIDVTPQEKETSDLRSAIFIDNLTKFMQLFGPQALNIQYAQKRFAILNREDPDKFLAKQAPAAPPGLPQPGQQPGQPPQGTPPQPGQGGPSVTDQMQPQQMAKPSLNTMMQS